MTITAKDIVTAKDIADLERIESEIEQDQTAFFRMAENLLTIRDRKLYRREYKTFEDYCKTRWGWTRQWVNQQIRSAEVIRRLPEKTLETLVSKVVSPLTESVARAIASVPERDRAKVIENVGAQGNPIDAKSISESAEVYLKNRTPMEEISSDPPKRKDETGWVIPENRLSFFDRSPLVDRMLEKLADVRGFYRRMQDSPDPLFRECDANGMLIECDKLYADMKRAIPYAVCPYCQGIKADACRACLTRGVMSKFMWDTAVPENMKTMRKRTLEDK